MFDRPKFIQNSLTIAFARKPSIRRDANKFEDYLKGEYMQPQIIGVPDELQPEVPRLVFGSMHGFSQIVISQVNMVLNVTYSPDWQVDIAKGAEYLRTKASRLFGLLGVIGEHEPYFCGLATLAHLRCACPEGQLLMHLARLLLNREPTQAMFDLEVRETLVHEEKFFGNISIQNYRTWNTGGRPPDISRLSAGQATERGIQILGDFNDRFAYNEQESYRSSEDALRTIIQKGIEQVGKQAARIQGAAHGK